MKSRIRTLERALALELYEVDLTKALEKLKHRWELAASTGGPPPSMFDLFNALHDARVAGTPRLVDALSYVNRHDREEGGPDCAMIFKILLPGSPVPESLEHPEPRPRKTRRRRRRR